MVLTTKQEEALKIAVARYKAHEPWTCISGYASLDEIHKYIYSFH